MSNALAIAGVTAVLQYYFNNLYAQPGVASDFPSAVTVSCLAPDQVQNLIGGASGAENQVNLFMHQVSFNAAWRNVDLASMSSDGKTRLSSPPLALDLHYLLTVYGSEYWQAEALLGYAMMMLHEAPVLTRADVSGAISTLTSAPLPYPGLTLTNAIGACGLADQIEMIKVMPETMTREEMAWLWTALKADYRPTHAFQVSAVLMQPQRPTSFALPVLQTVFGATPMNPPQILSIGTPNGQGTALPGDQVTVTGEFLAGATRVSLSNPRLGQPLTPTPTSTQGRSVVFTLPPDAAGEYPAGVYDLVVQWTDTTGVVTQSTNTLPLAIAPSLPTAQNALSAPSGTQLKVTLASFSPAVWEGQSVSLALSTEVAPIVNASAQALPFTGKATALDFLFPPGLPTGIGLLARLQVDGVPSPVIVNHPPFPAPPTFGGPHVTL